MSELCAELAALFPPGAIAAQLHGAAPPAHLSQDEIRAVRHCSEKRISDFSAGRLCARRALRELGIEGFSLLPAKDRQAVWPAGITGSITHTDGYSAAVVIRQGRVRSVGLDSEAVGAVHEELWPRICAPAELASLRTCAGAGRRERAAVTFAAKEAFYKSQFPLTGEWIGFEEVTIALAEETGEGGVFVVTPQRPLLLQRQTHQRLTGRFRRHGGFVTAGIALCADSMHA
jgi:enterobactin synthetase component D / holo-[acyl-carrier protein] synthase